ncbi:NC domain protein [Burkholderia sp. Bp8963]|uniref:lecithin retinol acyltransferase family protein n=1 Tax=Burkholderia sp. Bp8963 TaxID=2184547 RepID=UPI000F5B818E|nr:lecithin retinol acyltransferase family protein [Burkholderia sp. Bp8963]RQS57034.1 NC domain protein [Burkholderia sp. Bp8963]
MIRSLHQSSREQHANRAAAHASADVALRDCDDEPALGAHLITQRRGYEHHGIYVGSGKVIHYAGFAKSAHRGPVEEVPLEQFADGHVVAVRPHPFPKYSGEQAVRRARSRLGENRYRLMTNNCEHFCAWCVRGESRSEQVHACLTHPRAGLLALLCLASTFVGIRMNVGRAVARPA